LEANIEYKLAAAFIFRRYVFFTAERKVHKALPTVNLCASRVFALVIGFQAVLKMEECRLSELSFDAPQAIFCKGGNYFHTFSKYFLKKLYSS